MIKGTIVLNFKAYSEILGDSAVTIAKNIASVHNKGFELILVPTLLTLREVAKTIKIPVYSPHTDPFPPGPHTGGIIIDELKKLGIKGTLLNHSEKKLPFSILTKTVEYCKKKQFPVILCTSSLTEVKKMITLKPEYLAFEPPELIGGKISVSKAKPLSIIKTVQVVKKINPQTQVLCGAGIQNRDDLQKALQLGAQGVLLSHALIKTKKPEKVLEMMLS